MVRRGQDFCCMFVDAIFHRLVSSAPLVLTGSAWLAISETKCSRLSETKIARIGNPTRLIQSQNQYHQRNVLN